MLPVIVNYLAERASAMPQHEVGRDSALEAVRLELARLRRQRNWIIAFAAIAATAAVLAGLTGFV